MISTPRRFGHFSARIVNFTGSTGRNDVTTGSGDDVIDGNGGADNISAGAGNDTVTYRGSESTVDGGAAGDASGSDRQSLERRPNHR